MGRRNLGNHGTSRAKQQLTREVETVADEKVTGRRQRKLDKRKRMIAAVERLKKAPILSLIKRVRLYNTIASLNGHK